MIRRHREEKKKRVPFFSGMSMIEKFCIIFLPLLLNGVFYIGLENFLPFVWWIRLFITSTAVIVIYFFIFFIVTWLVSMQNY